MTRFRHHRISGTALVRYMLKPIDQKRPCASLCRPFSWQNLPCHDGKFDLEALPNYAKNRQNTRSGIMTRQLR